MTSEDDEQRTQAAEFAGPEGADATSVEVDKWRERVNRVIDYLKERDQRIAGLESRLEGMCPVEQALKWKAESSQHAFVVMNLEAALHRMQTDVERLQRELETQSHNLDSEMQGSREREEEKEAELARLRRDFAALEEANALISSRVDHAESRNDGFKHEVESLHLALETSSSDRDESVKEAGQFRHALAESEAHSVAVQEAHTEAVAQLESSIRELTEERDHLLASGADLEKRAIAAEEHGTTLEQTLAERNLQLDAERGERAAENEVFSQRDTAMSSEIESLNTQITGRTEERDALSRSLDERTQERDELNASAETLRADLEREQARASTAENSITEMHAELDARAAALEELESSRQTTAGELESTLTEVARIQAEFEAQTREHESLGTHCEDLGGRLEAADSEREQLAQNVAELQEAIERKDTDLDALAQEREGLTQERDRLVEELEGERQGHEAQAGEVQSQHASLETNIVELTEQIEGFNREREAFESSMAELQGNLDGKVEELTSAQQANEAQREELDKSIAELEAARTQLSDTQARLEQAEDTATTQGEDSSSDRVHELESRIQELEAQRDRLQSDLDAQSDRDAGGDDSETRSAAELELARVQSESDEARSAAEAVSKERDSLEEWVTDLMQQVETLNAELAAVHEKASQAAQTDEAADSARESEEERREWTTRIEQLQSDNDEAAAAAESLQARVSELQTQLEQSETRLDSAAIEQSREREELDAERHAWSQRESELGAAQAAVDQELAALRERSESLESERDQRDGMIRDLERRLEQASMQTSNSSTNTKLFEDRISELERTNDESNGKMQEMAAHITHLEQERIAMEKTFTETRSESELNDVRTIVEEEVVRLEEALKEERLTLQAVRKENEKLMADVDRAEKMAMVLGQQVEDARAENARLATHASTGFAGSDLTQIRGIGAKLAANLRELGIDSVAKVAALTDDDLERLDDEIKSLKSRADREEWIQQARELLR